MHEAFQIIHVDIKNYSNPDCFQLTFPNYQEFQNFFNDRISNSKIITKEQIDPICLRFSFENLPEEIVDIVIFDYIYEKLGHIGAALEYDLESGIFIMHLPNIEFLFILLMEILECVQK